jgi:hypothetical protein
MKILYVIPAGTTDLHGKIFEPQPPFAPIAPLGDGFLDFFNEKGIAVKTIDAWRAETHDPEDALLVLNHPDDGFLGRVVGFFKYTLRGRQRFAVTWKQFQYFCRIFPKKVLYQGEPPTNMPYAYSHLSALSRIYTTIFLFRKPDVSFPNVKYLMWPRDFRDEFGTFFAIPKTKFLTLINSNSRPRGYFAHELFSERLRGIRYFSGCSDFDLYGGRWDRRPYFPYSHYAKYVTRVWRGQLLEDKLPTLARYKFILAFENASYPGLVTEKIFDAFLAGTVPVYLGAPDITEYVPADCFIDMRKFENYAKLESFLRDMASVDYEGYRERFRDFLMREKDRIFSKRKFAEAIWNEVRPR